MSQLLAATGYEVKDKSLMFDPNISAFAQLTLDPVNFSPRGGAQSVQLDENSAVIGNTELILTSLSFSPPRRTATAFDFLVASAAADALILSLHFTGAANTFAMQLWRDTASGKLHWYQSVAGGLNNKGASIGADGLAIAAGTWYRIWIDLTPSTGAGTVIAQAYVADISASDPATLPIDCVGSTVNNNQTFYQAVFGGRVTGGLNNKINYDNVGVFGLDVDATQLHTVTQLLQVNGNGTDQDFSVTNAGADTQHWQAVDEQPQNGAGSPAVDVDYVSNNTFSTLRQETERVLVPTRVTNYDQPELIMQAIWHHQNSGKWSGGMHPRARYNGTARTYITSVNPPETYLNYADPGSVYGSARHYFLSSTSAGTTFNLAALTNLELGVERDATDGTGAKWTISTIVGEVTYSRAAVVSAAAPKKQSGLGYRFYIGGFDISGDVGAMTKIAAPSAVDDVTDLTANAVQRIHNLQGGEMGFSCYFNPARAHAVLKLRPTTDQVAMLFCGQSIGSPVAALLGEQINYDWSRPRDGSLLGSVDVLNDGFALEWCEALTAGKRTDAVATTGPGFDNGASTAFGLSAYLEVFAFAGTSATIKIEDSANGSSYATVATFAVVSAAPAQQRIETVLTATIRRYVRLTTAGTFSNLVFACAFDRYLGARA